MGIDKHLTGVRFKPLTEKQRRILRVIDAYVDDSFVDDGGAGSGNWGHKGRPGKRGGSGKGGGKHYRTEKKDGTGYEARKLDDPGEMAQKYMNGKRTAFMGGHGPKFAPKVTEKKKGPTVGDTSWIDGMSASDRKKSIKDLAFAALNTTDSGVIKSIHPDSDTLKKLENKAFQRFYEQHYNNPHTFSMPGEAAESLNSYLNAKAKCFGLQDMFKNTAVQFFKTNKPPELPNLDQKQAMQFTLDCLSGDKEPTNDPAYIFLKAKILGVDMDGIPSYKDFKKAKDEQKKKKWEEEQKRLQKEQQEAAKRGNDRKNERESHYSQRFHEVKQKIEAAKTPREVATVMDSMGISRPGKLFNFGNASLQNAKNAAHSFNMMAEEFPCMQGKFGGIRWNGRKTTAYAGCAMLPGANYRGGMTDGDIELDKAMGNTEETIKDYVHDLSLRFHCKGTDYTSIVTHELGHALDGYLTSIGVGGSQLGRSIMGGVNPNMTTHVSDILQKKVFAKLGKTYYTLEEMKDELSGYAHESKQEWFAECVAEYYHSPNPRKMCVTAMETLKEMMREAGVK